MLRIAMMERRTAFAEENGGSVKSAAIEAEIDASRRYRTVESELEALRAKSAKKGKK